MKKTFALVGSGKLAEIVVDALLAGLLPDYQLIGIYSRTKEKADRLAQKTNGTAAEASCASCASLEDLFDLKPDYIVESASPAAMKELVLPALRNGSSVVTLSIGAFADQAFYEEVANAAREHNARVHLVSGAIGGFDVLRTVALMGKCEASIDTEKGPDSLKGTAVYEESLQEEQKQVFSGNEIGRAHV